jgi:Sulfotransferase family
MAIRPIFVIGSPRSGTTMLGNYIGSARSVLNTGEYRALYLAYGRLALELTGQLTGLTPAAWEPHRARYVREVQQHAAEFVVRAAEEGGFTAFVDSSPLNALISRQLADVFPNALFVLALRHYTGVIQSIVRLSMVRILPGHVLSIDSYEANAAAAAAVWQSQYEAAMQLPRDRTIAFGYDRFCAHPQRVLDRFKAKLSAAQFPVGELDDSVFATSHAAHPEKPRGTVARRTDSGVELSAVPSYDASAWTFAVEAEVQPVVGMMDALLATAFPEDYSEPAGYPGAEALLEGARGAS